MYIRCLSLLLLLSSVVNAQQAIQVQLLDASNGRPVAGVHFSIGDSISKVSDRNGRLSCRLFNGVYSADIVSLAFQPLQQTIVVPGPDSLLFSLIPVIDTLPDVAVIASTRIHQRMEQAPLKVEVLGKEELNEESLIKPGNISSLLSDVSGVQLQQLSAVSGNANLRLQGLDGRYTQVLRDGMPLFDGFSSGFSLIQIPPLDLRQIELIKGSASTLYGGGAIGGLVNLISNTPAQHPEATLVTNYSSLHEVNLHYWQSQRFKQWGYTFMTGYTGQRASDVNEDGFSDLPRLQSLQLHPSLFWYPDSKTIIKFSYHYTGEQRTGGDMLALDQTSLDHTFFEANMLQRHNLAAQISRRINQQQSILVKASLGSFQQQQRSDSMLRSGRQQNLFTEASWLYEKGNMHLIGGLNLYGLKFNPTTRGYLFGSFRQFSEGVFTQLTESISRNSTLEVGFRLDHNQAYGYFPLPRLALFHRFNEHWGSRLGIGWGYSLPTPFVSFYRETDPGKLEALSDQIRAEHSIGYNAEINYRMHWKQNRLFINQAFFLTDVKNPLQLGVRSNGSQYLYNQDGPMRSAGTDTYIQLALGEWEFYFGYSLTLANLIDGGNQIPIRYTPRHRFASTIVKEWEHGWRMGIESSYTGYQFREDGSRTPGYLFIAAMISKEWKCGISVVLNGENLFDYRQSKIETMFTGTLQQPQFKSLWAPIDGRVLNLAMRYNLAPVFFRKSFLHS